MKSSNYLHLISEFTYVIFQNQKLQDNKVFIIHLIHAIIQQILNTNYVLGLCLMI